MQYAKNILLLIGVATLATSWVSKKKYDMAIEERDGLRIERARLVTDLSNCETSLDSSKSSNGVLTEKNVTLTEDLNYCESSNEILIDRMADLSVITSEGSQRISSAIEKLYMMNDSIGQLVDNINMKDSMIASLEGNIRRSLENVSDEDINIEVRGGAVFISISDKLLYTSGSANLLPQGETVMEKIAMIINDHEDFEVMIEGHTDNRPIAGYCMKDNWDLSAQRAIAVVRTLQENYEVDPARMIAGARAEYQPKGDNETAEGRSANRRTEVVILPKLDQFYDLMIPNK